ncbi:hypothetical protein [Sphingomonas morindae]|uniref:Uncharacterized protein n=1 Tax=Sphingomonas morindae TaxID=1541170 RepID=A0ABY4X4Y9_9SPHN|nr:hypothetical protein [Sphingomonas morindae]USI71962.1 hypothetical protein LHA26_11630 [Sphingomonas morindae]
MAPQPLATPPLPPEPARARAVFSTEDFSLLRTAVAHYLWAVQDAPDLPKFGNLYHRLGRIGG